MYTVHSIPSLDNVEPHGFCHDLTLTHLFWFNKVPCNFYYTSGYCVT